MAANASFTGPSTSSQPGPSRVQERFPPLRRTSPAPQPQPAASQPAQKFRNAAQRSTPWSASSVAPSSLRSQPSTSTTANKVNQRQSPPKLSSALFPDLPSSSNVRAKPQVSGNVSLKNILGSTGPTVAAAWGAGSSGGGESAGQEAEITEAEAQTHTTGKGKKGKGKQKQTLFTLGSFPA